MTGDAAARDRPSGRVAAGARRIAAYALALLVLLGVFALYARPDMMVTLGDLVWACFR